MSNSRILRLVDILALALAAEGAAAEALARAKAILDATPVEPITDFLAFLANPTTSPELDAWGAANEAYGAACVARAEAQDAYEEARKCRKCKGAGGLEHYRHVADGVCFACSGSGRIA
jgi:hypothetical protein